MPLTTVSDGQTITAAVSNANWALCVLTDTAKTISVTHTYTATQTFTGGWTAAAACTVSSGGIAVTGNSSVTGTLTITGTTVQIADAAAGVNWFSNGVESWTADLTTSSWRLRNSTNGTAITVTQARSVTIANGLTITAGGLTVTAGGLTVTASGLTVTAGGLTVSAGTTAVQALTCTTLTATGQLKTTITTQQLALHYDADNHLAVTVSSAGAVTYNATGASAGHSFSDTVTLASSAIVAGSGQALAFFGGVTALKQEVTGSAGGNAALQSLLSALETYGLITDSSS